MANGATIGFTTSYIGSEGDFNEGMKGGITGAISAGVAYGIGHGFGSDWHWTVQAAAHGTSQGLIAEARGGKFRDGFVGGAAGKAGGVAAGGIGGYSFEAVAARTAVVSAFAGLASEATGGSFQDAALSAAIVHLFNEEGNRIKIPERYKKIIEVGNIDIKQNIKEAAKEMSLLKWSEAVGSRGKWDFKRNKKLLKYFNSDLLEEFGNYHFGIVAAAWGFNLEGSLYGAGLYQVLKQGGGNPVDLARVTLALIGTVGGYLHPDSGARYLVRTGFTWGDNPGDSLLIMYGWGDYHDSR